MYEAQLQMFADMRKEMVKQQALFDRERKQAAYDQENTTREWEEMKHLNDQLLIQITALQNTQGLPLSRERPTAMEATSYEHS